MMSEMQVMNVQGIDCYEKDGVAYLKLDAVARGLGFTKKADSGNEVVNWTRVRHYLSELGVVQKCTTGDYIPENIFYRLAMKAKNDVAEKFQAKVADEIIPSIRKHGAYMTPETLKAAILIKRRGSDYNSPTQKSMEAGWFEIKERTVTKPDGQIIVTKTPKVTGKGQQYFVNKFLVSAK